MQTQTLKDKLVRLFEQPEDGPAWQRRIDRALYILILLSSLGVILETLPFVKNRPALYDALLWFENFAMAVFVVELLLLFWVFDRLYANCVNNWERFLLFFYTFIDILAVLPTVLFAFGSQHHDYFLTLRLLRVFKTFRHDDSVEIVLRAIVTKKDILFKTAIIIVITTVFLAVLLYEAENEFELAAQGSSPTQFTDIWTTITWSFSMFVGDLAGYVESGFMPTSPFGRFIAGVLGFLNIAIVVIPTGIIASGFLEVLEEKKIESQYKILQQAFRPKYNPTLKIALYERPRTVFTLQNALFIHQNNLFRILETKPGFRLRAVQSDANEKYSDTNLVEYYGYGTLTVYGVKRILPNAPATVICPDAFAQKGIGYFAYAISEMFHGNLISNERFLMNSLDIRYDASFLHNPDYHADEVRPVSKKKVA
ncbi:MAG: ion transporter [Bacteroidia bacterium]|nr:ion transporter [Bacteroidia bacterium]